MAVPAWFGDLLRSELHPWLGITDLQVSNLYKHYEFLERWSEKISLTSVEPGPELVIRHYCESLFLAAHLVGPAAAKVADIGSGAGFPGVPVSILHPEWAVTLVESVHRKGVFLRESTRHLSNVQVIVRRVEEIEQKFDWAVSRAVRPAEILANVPRLAPRVGLLVGEKSVHELRTVPGIAWEEPIRLPWGDRRFCIVGVVSRETQVHS
jgi:16S rRNA (guanine527-N7)-methyltransferase